MLRDGGGPLGVGSGAVMVDPTPARPALLHRALAVVALLTLTSTAAASPRAPHAPLDDAQRGAQHRPRRERPHHGGGRHGRHHGHGDPALREVPTPPADAPPAGDPAPAPRPAPRDPRDPLIPLPF